MTTPRAYFRRAQRATSTDVLAALLPELRALTAILSRAVPQLDTLATLATTNVADRRAARRQRHRPRKAQPPAGGIRLHG